MAAIAGGAGVAAIGNPTIRGMAKHYYEELRSTVGIAALYQPIHQVAKRFDVTRDFVRYHTRKAIDPLWHAGSWGGRRHTLFANDGDQLAAEIAVWSEMRVNPLRSRHQIQTAVHQQWGIHITEKWLRGVLKRWGYTNKKAAYRVMAKYTALNIHYYCVYLANIVHLPWLRLKFLDESHFDRRSLYQRRGYAASNRRVEGIKPATPGIPSCSITVLTTLSHPGGFVMGNPRVGRNGAVDFVCYILDMLAMGHLVSGDYLIMDNASIHVNGAQMLAGLLHDLNITVRFLPTYSPELNPCELIFAQMKQYIRNHRSAITIPEEIMIAAAHVQLANVVRYYDHCINYIIYGRD